MLPLHSPWATGACRRSRNLTVRLAQNKDQSPVEQRGDRPRIVPRSTTRVVAWQLGTDKNGMKQGSRRSGDEAVFSQPGGADSVSHRAREFRCMRGAGKPTNRGHL